MLSNNLKKLRKTTNLTQSEFAKKIDVARTTYAMYEQGHREPDYETLQRIADFFEVSTDFLLGRIDQPFPDPLMPVIGSTKKPPHKNIGMIIGQLMSVKRIKSKIVADALGLELEDFNYLRAGEIAPTEQQAEILADVLDSDKKIFLTSTSIKSDDEKDIAKRIQEFKKDLTSSDGLNFSGEPMSDDAKESLIEAMDHIFRQTQRINKKYIPNKHKKDED